MIAILANTCRLLTEAGRGVTREGIKRDVAQMFQTDFEQWSGVKGN